VRPIAFCHIPKTGGTSLQQFIADAYGAESVSEHVDSENYSTAIRASARYSVIIGHFWFRPGEILDPSRLNFTVLRDPIDRILSHFYFSRRLDSTIHPSAPERFMDFPAYAVSELSSVRNVTSNFQTRLLAPLGLPQTAVDPTDNELLLAAQRAIDSFDFVGIFQELEDTAACIACLAHISMSTEIPRQNVTRVRPAIADISDVVRRRLESLNELDRQLYSYASRRFLQNRRRLFVTSVNESATRPIPVSAPDLAVPARSPAPEPDRASTRQVASAGLIQRFGNRKIEVASVRIEGSISLGSGMLLTGENVSIIVIIAATVSTDDLTVGLRIHDANDRLVFGTNSWLLGRCIGVSADSNFSVKFTFRNTLGAGCYSVGISLHTGSSHLNCCYDWFDGCGKFNVVGIIGYHFEGAMSLAVSNEFAQIEGHAPTVENVPGRPGHTTIARHNPIPRNVGGIVRPVSPFHAIRSGDIVSLEIELESSCDQTLEFDGLRPIRVCYRWLDPVSRKRIQEEGVRTNLGVDLPPGKLLRTQITVASPPDFLGNAILRIVPVQENVGWFDEIGAFYCDIPVLIFA
jgi:Wzt C-terminal domain/Sulfotransferase family